MESHRVKGLSLDPSSRNRFRFATQRQRERRATADVYRGYKRRIGVASSANREESLHRTTHPVVKKRKVEGNEGVALSGSALSDLQSASLAEELDLAFDRNPSEVFSKFYRQIWYYVRSLPEIIHHREKIVQLMLDNLLSPEEGASTEGGRVRFRPNPATTDILHLLAVLARDLRHEIHPCIHTKILPRLVDDLLSPPMAKNQSVPLDVTIIEACIRTMSYCFRYDSEALLAETIKEGEQPCLELMRQYYGKTLAHRREVVRRLSAEAIAPLIRRLRTEQARKKHLKRVFKAMATIATEETSLQRAQENAVDGIVQLCLQLVQGVKGRLHSKSAPLISSILECCCTQYKNHAAAKVLLDIGLAFLKHLCERLNPTVACTLYDDVIKLLTRVTKEKRDSFSLASVLTLSTEMAAFNDGELVRSSETFREVLRSLSDIFSPSMIDACSSEVRTAAFEFLCRVWRAKQNDKKVNNSISIILENAVAVMIQNDSKGDLFFEILTKHVLPILPINLLLGTLGSIMLKIAAENDDRTFTTSLILSLAAVREIDSEASSETDSVLFYENAMECCVDDMTAQALLHQCLLNVDDQDEVNLYNLASSIQCTIFVGMLTCRASESAAKAMDTFQQVAPWLQSNIERFFNSTTSDADHDLQQSICISLSIFGLARYCSAIKSLSGEWTNRVKEPLVRSRGLVARHLVSRATSLWAVKSCAVYAKELYEATKKVLIDDPNQAFELLVPNLSRPSHFLRLYSLQILLTYPDKPFLTNHADLDLTDDLDEDPSEYPQGLVTKHVGLSGTCRLLHTLASLEERFPNFENERKIISLLSTVEVQGRSGKIPVPYVEAAISHMIGLLHVRFSPIWPAVQSAIVSLIQGCEQYAWPHLITKLSDLMFGHVPPPNKPTLEIKLHRIDELLNGFALWEISGGLDLSMFRQTLSVAEDNGRVSWHLVRAGEDVVLSLWGVFEKQPQLIVAHSRDVVRIVLRFLAFHFRRSQDPDAIEINLKSHLPSDDLCEPPTMPSRTVIENRMLAILKVTSKVNGPQQMHKHSVLQKVFISLLDYPDALAQHAFSSLLRFKPDYLLPHADPIKRLFVKGKMREALLQLKEMKKECIIPVDHRRRLVPILTRILLGRVSSKNTTRSAKDTPAARRVAIFSFLAGFCEGSEDLYPSIYLSIRQFVPVDLLKEIGSQTSDDREALCNRMSQLAKGPCERLPSAVHEGFLNVLEAIVSQLGQRVLRYVPIFVSIILEILEVHAVSSTDRTDMNDDNELVEGVGSRSGRIRTLCFRRISEIFDNFATVYDFSEHIARMWDAVDSSLPGLPESAASSHKCPALMTLLRSISSNTTLLSAFLHKDFAVEVMVKSLGSASSKAVIDTILSFVEDLLGTQDPENASATGNKIILGHLGPLLDSFRTKISSSASSTTLRREITVLCGVSELISKNDGILKYDKRTVDTLAELLLPYLGAKSKLSEKDKSNIVSVLETLIPGLSESTAEDFYQKLSMSLGPDKAGGVLSLTTRYDIAKTLNCVVSRHFPPVEPVSEVVLGLCAMNTKRVGELDYDSSITMLQRLGKDGDAFSWAQLCSETTEWVTPVIQTCFHFLHDEDGVQVRTSLRALRELISLASVRSSESNEEFLKWKKILEGKIMPLIRSGLLTKEDSTRRIYVQLLCAAIKDCSNIDSPYLHGDMVVLTNSENLDLDFFHGICHVQVHRRAKALTRLRRSLAEEERENCRFTLQSLSNILLPLALHPIYEAKTKEEDSFALEAVATVGTIAHLLSWSKYNNLIGTLLNQFRHHPEQEKYLVGTVCSVLDNMNFSLEGDNSDTGSAVLRTLEKRIIPKTEELLTKEVKKAGRKEKSIRPSIVLALLKLSLRLPKDIFLVKLQRLLTVLCDALKNRDSSIREVARTTLAKVAVSMDISFFADIIRELAISLKEGYQLHVRAASVHSILLELSDKARKASESPEGFKGWDAFDKSVPALLDLIQEDLFGVAQERKEAEGSQVRFVKEAGGTKSAHSLELIASMITFAPRNKQKGDVSAVDNLVAPFLERLKPDGGSKVIRRTKECLDRIIQGLAKNKTVTAEKAFGFAYATINHHIEQEVEIESVVAGDEPDDNGVESLKVSTSGPKRADVNESATTGRIKGSFSMWRPSVQGASNSERDASELRRLENRSMRKVQDGSSAPKLTGSSRTNVVHGAKSLWNNPASIAAQTFGLQMLQIALRKESNSADLLDPFVPLLSDCIRKSGDNEVLRLAMKSLGTMLNEDLTSIGDFSGSLSFKTVDLLVSSSGNEELQHSCFKLLTYLMKSGLKEGKDSSAREDLLKDQSRMDILLSFIRQSLLESEQHSQAISLLKAIVARKYSSSDMYDLMECLLEQSVRSQKDSLRQQCSAVYLSFLLNYPMTDDRLEQELKQVILNIEYEHADGRLSALDLLNQIVQKIPTELLETKSQIFFLPLTMRLANDQSDQCRMAVAKCIKSILSRASTEICQSLLDYTSRWVQNSDKQLRRTALQLYGLFFESVPVFCRQERLTSTIMSTLNDILDKQGDSDWESQYFALSSLEKISAESHIDPLDGKYAFLCNFILDGLIHDHPWIQLVSSRILWKHLQSLEPNSYCEKRLAGSFFTVKGTLFTLGKTLCSSLAQLDGDSISDEKSDFVATVVKLLTWTLQAMEKYPALCFTSDAAGEGKSPTRWVFKRLSGVAKLKQSSRRQAVFSCYISFIESNLDKLMKENLDCTLEALHRVELEFNNDNLSSQWRRNQQTVAPSKEAELAQEVLHMLESKYEQDFLEAYGVARKKAKDNKDERKRKEKAEAARDPKLAAERKIQKNLREKHRRKRRIEERRRDRGASAKRRHLNLAEP